MPTEEELRQMKRFAELAEKSYQQNIYLFTGFLGLGEQTLFYRAAPQFSHVSYTLFGGHPSCERLMVRFGDVEQMGYEGEYPIACVRIRPSAPKFAEALTHRDYLGALINLGIERSVIGDIFTAEKAAFVYCQDNMSGYICENLTRVKHTAVICELAETVPEEALPHLTEKTENVASERLDVILAAVYHLSRSQCIELFRSGRVFVNGCLYENNSGKPKQGDIVSLRGYGRFVYDGVVYETKKGRFAVKVEVYQ